MIRDSQQRPHERLDVWRDTMTLVQSIYRITEHFPDSERFGLIAQMRRAAVSVPPRPVARCRNWIPTVSARCFPTP
ncbi:four helix bundle protein [Pantoea ananatis]|uniref:four helix bundle protein n=1 Tax=Pantoea ananas TaxID=553 RepID=UPI0022211BDF|nr:four helix bundle protein [Pantoea ananatis]